MSEHHIIQSSVAHAKSFVKEYLHADSLSPFEQIHTLHSQVKIMTSTFYTHLTIS